MKKRIPLTEEENKSHRKEKLCYICKKEFSYNDEKCYKVEDHRHYTRKYSGAAHKICDLRDKITK